MFELEQDQKGGKGRRRRLERKAGHDVFAGARGWEKERRSRIYLADYHNVDSRVPVRLNRGKIVP